MSNPDAADYYARLGAEPTMGDDQLRRVARDAQKRYHPDRNEHPESRRQFDRVMKACDCLFDPDERAAYDVFRSRFGSEDAVRVFERWTARGRFQSPESFTPWGATAESASATTHGSASGSRARTASKTAGSRRTSKTATESTRGATEGSTRESNNGSAQEGSETTGTSHRTHANFGHRRAYERRTYEPPRSVTVGRWVRMEAAMLVRESVSLFAFGLTAAIGVVLAIVLAVVLMFGSLLVGTVLAVFEVLLRSAGMARFNAYLVAEIGLTWLLEFCIIGATLLAVVFLHSLIYDREWDDHLGNRLRVPQRILLAPIGVLAAVAIWLRQTGSLQAVLVDLEPTTSVVVMAATWLCLHRGTLLLREAPPNHTGESILDSTGWTLFLLGTGSLLLATFVLGAQAITGSWAEATEYAILAGILTPTTLLGAGGAVAAVTVALGVLAGLYAGVNSLTVSTDG